MKPMKVKSGFLFKVRCIKGQIKSEWIFQIINFPKNYSKHLKDSCPMYYTNSQGRNPSNLSDQFLEIDDFIN